MTNFQLEFRRSPIEIGELNGRIRRSPELQSKNALKKRIQDCDFMS